MKFTIKGADLYKAVRHLAPVARTSLDASDRRIRIRCSGNPAEFAVVGRAMTVRRFAPYTGESFEGDVFVDANLLQKLATKLKKYDVVMEPKRSGEVELAASNTSVIFPASDGPNLPAVPTSPTVFLMPAALFRGVMAAAIPLASNDDRRPALCGVYVDQVAGEVNATTTNGAVLYTRTIPEVSGLTGAIILPTYLLKVALKLVDANGDSVAIRCNDSLVTIEQTNRFEVTGDAVDATYPDFRASLPDPSRNPVAVFDGREMLDALDAGRPFLSQSEAVRVSYNGAVTIEMAGDHGDFFADIGGQYDRAEERKVTFNSGYLGLACKTLNGDRLRQYVASSLEPQIFVSDETIDGVQVVVMPMRI